LHARQPHAHGAHKPAADHQHAVAWPDAKPRGGMHAAGQGLTQRIGWVHAFGHGRSRIGLYHIVFGEQASQRRYQLPNPQILDGTTNGGNAPGPFVAQRHLGLAKLGPRAIAE